MTKLAKENKKTILPVFKSTGSVKKDRKLKRQQLRKKAALNQRRKEMQRENQTSNYTRKGDMKATKNGRNDATRRDLQDDDDDEDDDEKNVNEGKQMEVSDNEEETKINNDDDDKDEEEEDEDDDEDIDENENDNVDEDEEIRAISALNFDDENSNKTRSLSTSSAVLSASGIPEDLNILDRQIEKTMHILMNYSAYQRRAAALTANQNSEATTANQNSSESSSVASAAIKSRAFYRDALLRNMERRFGYNPDLLHRLYHVFNADLLAFVRASDSERPLTIRTNTLKTRRAALAQSLVARGVSLTPLSWSKVALQINASKVPLGATPEYLAGLYILQGASSLLPVLALRPQPGMRVLDMCAAPGGKATYIAQLMRGAGTLHINDVSAARLKAAHSNLARMGAARMVVASCDDGRRMTQRWGGGSFDRVLVDAPCTGSGVISKDPSVKANRTQADILRCATMQRQLLRVGLEVVRPGGVVVYSTCSVLVEENELVVHRVMTELDDARRAANTQTDAHKVADVKKDAQKEKQKKRGETASYEIVESGLAFGTEAFSVFRAHRFHPSMRLARRFYPHTDDMDGFFVCKIRKRAV